MPAPPKPSAPPKPAGLKAPKPPPSSQQAKVRVPKNFSIAPWTGDNEGEKILIYAESGMGKTTLACMMPGPVFIGVDDGARKIRDPRTGTPVNAVEGVETFDDIRDALHSRSLWEGHQSVVLDTITKVEELSEPFVLENSLDDKGKRVKSIEGFGWGKGYRHVGDAMRLIRNDLDALVKRGLNVCLLAQQATITIANPGGLDYLQAGPRLIHNKQASVRDDFKEWVDHVLRIGFLDMDVVGAKDARVGKVVSENSTRAVYTVGAQHFIAKSRTLKEPVISFESESDDSLWKWMFPS